MGVNNTDIKGEKQNIVFLVDISRQVFPKLTKKPNLRA